MNTIILFIFIFLILLISGFKERCESGTNIITALPKDYTNALRGLAIIMIMYGHVCGRYHESVWFSPFACTGVALFLFLSGYGNNESFIKNGRFPLLKLLKLIIPYWIILFLVSILGYEELNIYYLFFDFTFIKTSYWFVGYIFKWYLIFWFAVNFAYKYRWYIFILAALLSFVFLTPLESEQSFSFICGIYVSENKERIFKIRERNLDIIALLLFVIGTFALGVKQISLIRNNEMLMAITQLCIKLPYALAIVILMRKIKFLRYNPVFLFLAPITYELYLVHMPLLDFIDISSHFTVLYTTIGLFFISVIFSILVHKINRGILGKIFTNY